MQTDYPQGDGRSDCPACKGRGVVSVAKEKLPLWLPMGATMPCQCVRERDMRDHLETVWKLLSTAEPVVKTPLQGSLDKANLWVTAPLELLKGHLAKLARDRGLKWKARVITDIDLMTTWLYSANEVLDPDVEMARERGENTSTRITDLVEPPDLLIIRLGAKAARNVAAPEVFLEALNHRQHLGKPTWIVDTPGYPLDNQHICFDYRVGDFLSDWPRLQLSQKDSTTAWSGAGYRELDDEVLASHPKPPSRQPRPQVRQPEPEPEVDEDEIPSPSVGLKLFADTPKKFKKGRR